MSTPSAPETPELPSPPPGPRPRWIRWRGGAIAVVCLVVLALSAVLDPEPSGQGTHEQLGLPACSSIVTTGYPCPSCGLTTSMAAMARGRVVFAAQAQPFGVVAFAATVVLAVGGLAEVFTGRDWLRHLRIGPWWIAAGIGGLLAGWAIKLAVGCATGAYPVH